MEVNSVGIIAIKTYTSVAKIPRVPVENQITTLGVVKIAIKFSPCTLTRHRVLHYLSRRVKFYFLSFHVIDIKRLFQCNKLLYDLDSCPFTEYVG